MATTTWDRSASAQPAAGSARDNLSELELQDALDRYWSRVCRMLHGLVGDWDEAEDLALEAFYRLHKEPPERRDTVGTWLYRVATNLGLNALRARKRRRDYEIAAGELRLQRDAPVDPDVEVERREQQERVRRVLRGMRPRAARLLLLRSLGLSYAELSESVGIAAGSVGTLLARAEAEFERQYLKLEDQDATS